MPEFIGKKDKRLHIPIQQIKNPYVKRGNSHLGAEASSNEQTSLKAVVPIAQITNMKNNQNSNSFSSSALVSQKKKNISIIDSQTSFDVAHVLPPIKHEVFSSTNKSYLEIFSGKQHSPKHHLQALKKKNQLMHNLITSSP